MVPTKKKDPDATSTPKLVPAGTYDALITGAVEGKSKKTSKPMLTLDVEIVHEGKSKVIKYYIVFEGEDGGQTWSLVNFLETLTVPEDTTACTKCGGKDGAKDDCKTCGGSGEAGAPATNFVGRQAMATIEHETSEYNGRTQRREKISRFERHPDGPIVTGCAPQNPDADDEGDSDLPF